MRRKVLLFLCVSALFMFAGCNSGGKAVDTPPAEPSATPTPTKRVYKEDEMIRAIINDDATKYTDPEQPALMEDQMTFSEHWKLSWGEQFRYVNGDERWVTTGQYDFTKPAWVEIKFVGHEIEVYGHTCPNGGRAKVELDGTKRDEVAEWYSGKRIETYDGQGNSTNQEPVLKITGLEDGQHVLKLTMIEDKDPKAGNTHEAAIDYAVTVRRPDADVLIGLKTKETTCTTLVNYSAKAPFITVPTYADKSGLDVVMVEGDSSIVRVEKDGTVVGLKPGTTDVKVAQRGCEDKKASFTVTVKEANDVIKGTVDKPGLYTFKSMYNSYLKKFINDEQVSNGSLTLFQNDIVNSKIVLLSSVNEAAKTVVSEFKSENGDVLPADVITAKFMSSVRSHSNGEDIFDIIGSENGKLVAADLNVIWVEAATDANTKPGKYTGKISVKGDKTDISFDYTVEVIGVDISAADKNLTFELWEYPYSADRYYSGKSVLDYFGTDRMVEDKRSLVGVHLNDANREQVKAQIELYAKGGGDIITATVIEDAWKNQCHDPYPSMVKWIRKADGTFTFDYSDFDKWVELNFECGVDKKIKVYSPGSWANYIYFYDEATQQYDRKSISIGDKNWREMWTIFLKDFAIHTEEKGWFDKVYIASDERPVDVITQIIQLRDGATNSKGETFKLSMAVNRLDASKYFKYFDEIAISSSQFDICGDVIKERKAQGLSTCFYTCGDLAGALTYEPMVTISFFYRLYKAGANGYLRWDYDSYTAEPLKSTDHWMFVAGDQSIIYPTEIGEKNFFVQSSARYEVMMEAYKKIAAIETLKMLYPETETEINDVLNKFSYTRDNDKCESLNNMVTKVVINAAKKALEK